MPQLGGHKKKDEKPQKTEGVVSAYSPEGIERIKAERRKNRLAVIIALGIMFVVMGVAILFIFAPWNNG